MEEVLRFEVSQRYTSKKKVNRNCLGCRPAAASPASFSSVLYEAQIYGDASESIRKHQLIHCIFNSSEAYKPSYATSQEFHSTAYEGIQVLPLTSYQPPFPFSHLHSTISPPLQLGQSDSSKAKPFKMAEPSASKLIPSPKGKGKGSAEAEHSPKTQEPIERLFDLSSYHPGEIFSSLSSITALYNVVQYDKEKHLMSPLFYADVSKSGKRKSGEAKKEEIVVCIANTLSGYPAKEGRDASCQQGKDEKAAYAIFFGPESKFNTVSLLPDLMEEASGDEGAATSKITQQFIDLKAFRAALEVFSDKILKRNTPVKKIIIVTQSDFLVSCFNKYVWRWEKHEYRTTRKTKVVNWKLIKILQGAMKRLADAGISVVFWPVSKEENDAAVKMLWRFVDGEMVAEMQDASKKKENGKETAEETVPSTNTDHVSGIKAPAPLDFSTVPVSVPVIVPNKLGESLKNMRIDETMSDAETISDDETDLDQETESEKAGTEPERAETDSEMHADRPSAPKTKMSAALQYYLNEACLDPKANQLCAEALLPRPPLPNAPLASSSVHGPFFYTNEPEPISPVDLNHIIIRLVQRRLDRKDNFELLFGTHWEDGIRRLLKKARDELKAKEDEEDAELLSRSYVHQHARE